MPEPRPGWAQAQLRQCGQTRIFSSLTRPDRSGTRTDLMRSSVLIELVLVASASCIAMPPTATQNSAICDDCELLGTSEDATCRDFDPVTCKETTSDNIQNFPSGYSYDICHLSNYEYCKSPATCVLDQVPEDLHLELYYNGQSTAYGVTLSWPILNSSCVTGYYVLEYKGHNSDPYASCETSFCFMPSNNAKFSLKDYFALEAEARSIYVTYKVVAYPVYIWTVSYKVDLGENPCLARCGGCSCQYHSSPTNLTWTKFKDQNGAGRLSWDSESNFTSVYYLHLNSSTSGKLLYLINGTKSSVVLRSLTGNVTVWMESYNFDCGCSNHLDAQVLLIDTDAVSASITTAPNTSPTALSATVYNSISSDMQLDHIPMRLASLLFLATLLPLFW